MTYSSSEIGGAMEPSDQPRRPGASSGLSAIITNEFDVSDKPSLSREEVLERVERALAERGVKYDLIAVSDTPVRRNALIDAGNRRVSFPNGRAYERCFVALVDLHAGARWAHPAYWAFVPADGLESVVLHQTSLPEHPRGQVRLYTVR